jgi:hypothetical protein
MNMNMVVDVLVAFMVLVVAYGRAGRAGYESSRGGIEHRHDHYYSWYGESDDDSADRGSGYLSGYWMSGEISRRAGSYIVVCM